MTQVKLPADSESASDASTTFCFVRELVALRTGVNKRSVFTVNDCSFSPRGRLGVELLH